MKKIRVVKKKNTPSFGVIYEREPVTMRCGSRVSIITFTKRNGKIRGEVSYQSDFSVPHLREVSTVMAKEYQ